MLDRCYAVLQAILGLAPEAASANPAVPARLFAALLSNTSLVEGASMLQTLKALLAAFPTLQPSVTKEALQFIFAAGAKATSPDAECRQAAVSVLAALCTAPHTEQIDRAVCEFLLEALRTDPSVMVADEVLNAFMDIYGSDEGHRTVFDDLRVLVEVQQQAATFKRRGKEAGGEEQMQVKETALNVKRFAKYMSGGN